MTHHLTSRGALVVAALLVVGSGALGCSSVVGLECRAPYTRCAHACFDLSSDPQNCGACAHACPARVACVLGVCGGSLDAGVSDGGSIDGSALDGGSLDGGSLDGSSVDGGSVDGGSVDGSSVDGGSVDGSSVDGSSVDGSSVVDSGGLDAALDGGTVSCGLGQLACAGLCVDPNDPAHCGDCVTVCAPTEVCSAGRCTPTCAPLASCGGVCVDLDTNPDHCGSCAVRCPSGICVAGVCEAALAGHLVVIGHDYEQRRIAMSSLLANAVLLPGRADVRLLEWRSASSPLSAAGTTAAIAEAARGRTYTETVVSDPDRVPVLLASSDAFLVYAQRDASDAELLALGATWSTALAQFLDRGGDVVVLDTPSASNAGTFQILSAAGLFDAAAITEVVHPTLMTVSGRAGDPVLVGVPLSYRGESHTVYYTTTDPDAIVASASGPTVFDRTIAP